VIQKTGKTHLSGDCSVISELKFSVDNCPSFESLGFFLSDSCRRLSCYIALSFPESSSERYLVFMLVIGMWRKLFHIFEMVEDHTCKQICQDVCAWAIG
jgi:hypothetical protein